jgi:hypothetical protein
MILDETTQAQLDELAQQAGSRTEAVKTAVDSAYKALRERAARKDLIEWLIEQGGQPVAEDEEWARSVAAGLAAARERLR